jgi:Glycosyltransferase
MTQKKVILFVSVMNKMNLNKAFLLLPLFLQKVYGCEAVIYTPSKASDVPSVFRGVRIIECPDFIHRVSSDHIFCDLFLCFGYGLLTPSLALALKEVNPHCVTCFVTDHAANLSCTTSANLYRRFVSIVKKMFLFPLYLERIPKEKKLGKQMFSAFDVFCVETEASYQEIAMHGWLHVDVSSKLFLLPMGYDDDMLPQVDRQMDMTIQRDDIFLFTGIIGGDNKDHRVLLKAIAKVKDWKNWKVVLNGPVRPWFAEAVSSLIRKRPDLAQRLDYSTNSPNRAGLFQYYRTAKVFILTSDRESFCYSLAEASLLGDYILSTPVGIAPVCTNNGEFGSLYQIGSASQLASKMQAIIDGKIDINHLAKKSQICTRSELSYLNIVSRCKLFRILQKSE